MKRKLTKKERLNNIKRILLPWKSKYIFEKLKSEYTERLIEAIYSEKSIQEKLFYNVGAGNQRSNYDIWTYIDLKSDSYQDDGIDIYHDLESLGPLPLNDNVAEVVFSSFVMEHISWNASKKLSEEAYRVLKTGGIFHSKVHCFHYGIRLWQRGLVSPQIFNNRDTASQIKNFIEKNNKQVSVLVDSNGNFKMQSESNEDFLSVSPVEMFIAHNATASIRQTSIKAAKNSQSLEDELNSYDPEIPKNLYEKLKENIDLSEKKPHQHNADYINAEMLKEYLIKTGFKEVYITQPFQSVSPVLWEEKLNLTHNGFVFSVEAIK